jgi:hypothetical protein
MSKILIENYRGWEIYFDNDKENFYTSSDEYDRMNTKTSYAATKKWIDDFIKENTTFEPIWVEKRDYRGVKKIKIIGIRKDKKFIYEGKDGKKEQLSEYDEKDCFLPNSENDDVYNKIKIQKDIKDAAELEISKLEKLIVKTPILDELKEKYKNLYI